MNRLMKAEFFRFCHTYALWMILGLLLTCAGVSICTGVYGDATTALMSVLGDSMVPLLACAVYGGLLLTDDFSNGMFRHMVASGYPRGAVVGAKFLHFMAGCSLLLFLYPFLSLSLAVAVQGDGAVFASLLETMLRVFVRSLPLYWGMFGLFFLIAMLVQKGAAAMGICVALSILTVVFSGKLAGSVQGVWKTALELNPVIQLQFTARDGAATWEYGVSAVLSLAAMGLFLFLSILRVRREEF